MEPNTNYRGFMSRSKRLKTDDFDKSYLRQRFLSALQVVGFWEPVRAMVLKDQEHPENFWPWTIAELVLEAFVIVDPWFRNCVEETIKDWLIRPDSPASRLQPGYVWWTWSLDAPHPEFGPVFTDPHPRFTIPETSQFLSDFRKRYQSDNEARALIRQIIIEEETHFQRRMRRQFEKQLREYTRSWYRSKGVIKDPNTERDAELTALRFCGVSAGWIARIIFRDSKAKDAESMVRTATARYARRIELTLPARRSKESFLNKPAKRGAPLTR